MRGLIFEPVFRFHSFQISNNVTLPFSVLITEVAYRM